MLISSKNTLTESSRKMFIQISEHCGPAKLTHKINYHKYLVIIVVKARMLSTSSSQLCHLGPRDLTWASSSLAMISPWLGFSGLRIQAFLSTVLLWWSNIILTCKTIYFIILWSIFHLIHHVLSLECITLFFKYRKGFQVWTLNTYSLNLNPGFTSHVTLGKFLNLSFASSLKQG